MKMTYVKKFLAVLASAAMLVGILVGCGNQSAAEQTGSGTADDTGNNIPAGMVLLSTEAAINITYNADGMVLDVEGINDYGFILADGYTDYTGKSCADAVTDLITASSDAASLSPDVENVILKLSKGSAQPGTNFLETLGTAAQSALDSIGATAKLTLIGVDDLDEDGYISLDIAKALLMNQLGVDKLDAYYGSTSPSDDAYICTVDVGGVESSYSIDAVTGLISEATDEELMNDPAATDPAEEHTYDPEEEVGNGENDMDEIVESDDTDIDIPLENPGEE